MELKILKDDFLKALNAAQGVVEKKNVMPILANILLEAEGSLLKISVTDLEVAVIVVVPAQITTAGKITISAKNLFDIIREAPSEEVVIRTTDSNYTEIIFKQSQYRILSLPASEFPKLPKVEGDFSDIQTELFLKMLDKVYFAMSQDETRYHLNGVLIDKFSETEVATVATDGHRLALSKQELQLVGMKQKRIIIPRKGVNELRKMVGTHKKFQLAISERHVFIQTENQTLFIRLIDGEFPDYQRVIPDQNEVRIQVPRQDLIGALKRVSLLSSDRSHGVSLYFCNNSLTVSTSNPEIGEAKEEIILDYKGAVLNIGFNARYFLDVLSVIPDDMATVDFKDALSPTLISCSSDPGFRSVIMPMRM